MLVWPPLIARPFSATLLSSHRLQGHGMGIFGALFSKKKQTPEYEAAVGLSRLRMQDLYPAQAQAVSDELALSFACWLFARQCAPSQRDRTDGPLTADDMRYAFAASACARVLSLMTGISWEALSSGAFSLWITPEHPERRTFAARAEALVMEAKSTRQMPFVATAAAFQEWLGTGLNRHVAGASFALDEAEWSF